MKIGVERMVTTIDGGVIGNHLVDGGANNVSLVVAGLKTKKTKMGGKGGWQWRGFVGAGRID